MFGVGLPELVLIGVVAMLAFGPDKLPELARQAGRMVRQVQDFNQLMREELRRELGLDDEAAPQAPGLRPEGGEPPPVSHLRQ